MVNLKIHTIMGSESLIDYRTLDGRICGKCLRLYMYVDECALDSIINYQRLRISCPWRTNDVTECVYADEYSQSEDTKRYGYLCFSAVRNSPAMWGYYANRGKGACLVFDFDVKEAGDGIYEVLNHGLSSFDKPICIYKVNYNHFRVKKKMGDSSLSRMYIKSMDWSHEEEYRMICEISPDMENEKGDRGINFYVYEPLMFLSGIILGPSCSKQIVEVEADLRRPSTDINIRNRCLNNVYKIEKWNDDWKLYSGSYIREVNVYRAKLNKSKFLLDSHIDDVNAESFINYKCKFDNLLRTEWKITRMSPFMYSGNSGVKVFVNENVSLLRGGKAQYFFLANREEDTHLRYSLYVQFPNGKVFKLHTASTEYLSHLASMMN